MPAAARAGDLVPQVVHDPDAERAFDVPGTPYLLVLDEMGIVRAKGTVNNLEQVEGLVDTAGRRMREERERGRADDVRSAPNGRSRNGRAGAGSSGGSGAAWSRSRAARWSRPRSLPTGRRRTTSVGTRTRRARARIRTRRSRGPIATGSRSTRRTAIRSTTGASSTATRRPRSARRPARSASGGLLVREQPPLRRRLDPVLLRPAAAHPGLLLPLEHPDQRRLRGARLLPRRAQGVLHHVPRAHAIVLSDGGLLALAAAAAVAGWSALWGP